MVEDEVLQGQQASTRSLADPERDGLEYPIHQDSARPPAAVAFNPEDGLPQQIPNIGLKDSLAPRLTPKRFVCMADKSVFVQRDVSGEIKERFSPEQVERAYDGTYLLKVPEDCKCQSRDMYIAADGKRYQRLVEPLRPQCEHYMRQLIPWPDDTERNRCQRLCAALKNEQGELLSLADQEILACELRRPRDYEADKKLDEFDELVMYTGERALEEQSEFSIDAALAQENLGVLGGNK